MNRFTIYLLLPLLALACKKAPPPDPDPDPLTPLEIQVPFYVAALEIPSDNPTTVEGVALGRKLYYDTKLSLGGPMQGNACASCHHQQYGFTVPGPSLPPVMPHVNLAWHRNWLWDGRESGTLEDVMHFEVAEFFQADVSLFHADADYLVQFKRVFGTETPNHTHFAKAMAQWLRTVNSFDAPFDKFMKGEGFLSDAAARGFLIFNSETGDCFHCHSVGLFTDGELHNIGLDSAFNAANLGHYNVTGNPMDKGKFRTATLRNVALRGPYMHDGRFATLEEVVEHYNSGVKPSPSLDPIMTKPGKELGLGLNTQQKADLVAFLESLTDNVFITNPALGHP